MNKWNPAYKSVSQFFVPKVFLHDEITTDGYGKCIIELLTLHGILVKQAVSESTYEWVLSDNWDEKNIILCLDGLSLDRHRCFGNKLIKVPMNFTRAYKQSLVFKQALTRVIEISGPLHTAFHMLQSIFNIYRCFMKTMQDCIGWKKMKLNKVSENYRPCLSLIDMVYEETFRILFFNYLISLNGETINDDISNEDMITEVYCLQIATGFQSFIQDKIDKTTDMRFRLLLCFFKITHLFKPQITSKTDHITQHKYGNHLKHN